VSRCFVSVYRLKPIYVKGHVFVQVLNLFLRRATLLAALLLLGVVVINAQEEDPVVITLSYNTFLQNSFGDGPPPLDVIRAEVAEAYPNYEIQLNIAPDAIDAWRDQLSVAFTAEDGTIDIYGMDTPWVLEFGQAGWAVPLAEALPDLEADFVESGLEIFSFDDQVLAVPFWGSIGGLFYRADILSEYGYEPPATYDELREIAADITAQDPSLTGFVWAGAKEEGLVQVWAEFFLGFGGFPVGAVGAAFQIKIIGIERIAALGGGVGLIVEFAPFVDHLLFRVGNSGLGAVIRRGYCIG